MDDEETTLLELVIQKSTTFEHASTKKAKVNKVARTLQNFAGHLKAIIFAPQDLEMLTGSPTLRRRYVDLLLYQVSDEYKKIHTEYLQAVKSRNKILEKIKIFSKGMDELGFWNTKVVQMGILIQEYRETLLRDLSDAIYVHNQKLNQPNTKTKIQYIQNPISYERIHEYQDREIASKSTLIGPHRDDFEISLDNKNVAEFGSRGQQRSTILALKLAEIDYFVHHTKKQPILLLDDVFSELDQKHEQALIETIHKQQTIITTTEIPDFIREKANKIIQMKEEE